MLLKASESKNYLSSYNFGDCAIAFPGTPQIIRTDRIKVEGEKIDLHKIIFENPVETYLFARAYLSDSYLKQGSEIILNRMIRYLLADFDCQELEYYAQNIKYKCYPGKEFHIIEDNSGLIMRLYLVEGKLYLLLVGSDRLKEAKRFFNSFQILSNYF